MKKSLYIFLCAMLGALLFLILHRLIMVVLLVLSLYFPSLFDFNISYLQFVAIDYFTLIIALMLGFWYGTWLGIYWFEQVYETQAHGGIVDHITRRYWPKRRGDQALKSRLLTASKKLGDEMWELENLAKEIPPAVVVKRRATRPRVSKKIE